MSDALKRLVAQIKAEDKAQSSLSDMLKKIIDDYCDSGRFDSYLKLHREDMFRYIESPDGTARKGLFRASSAGKCLQRQAFDVLWNWRVPTVCGVPFMRSKVRRPSRQARALYNGTFAHVRWHMLFDALHEAGVVETLYAEELRYYASLELSGTPDRVVRIMFNGRPIIAIIDFKTIKHEYFMALREPQEDHTMQQHSYETLGFGADRWIMIYEDKNDHELKIYDRAFSFDMTQLLHTNLKRANHWAQDVALGLTPEYELSTETSWCNYCEYNATCKQLHPNREDLVRKL